RGVTSHPGAAGTIRPQPDGPATQTVGGERARVSLYARAGAAAREPGEVVAALAGVPVRPLVVHEGAEARREEVVLLVGLAYEVEVGHARRMGGRLHRREPRIRDRRRRQPGDPACLVR